MRELYLALKRKFRKKSGFSLVESIAAVSLMVVVSAVILPMLTRGFSYVMNARTMRVKSNEAVTAISSSSVGGASDIGYTTGSGADFTASYTIDFSGSNPSVDKYNSSAVGGSAIEGTIGVVNAAAEDGLVNYYAAEGDS